MVPRSRARRRRPYSISILREELNHRVGAVRGWKDGIFEPLAGPCAARMAISPRGTISRGKAHPSAWVAYAMNRRSDIVNRILKEMEKERRIRTKQTNKTPKRKSQIPVPKSPRFHKPITMFTKCTYGNLKIAGYRFPKHSLLACITFGHHGATGSDIQTQETKQNAIERMGLQNRHRRPTNEMRHFKQRFRSSDQTSER